MRLPNFVVGAPGFLKAYGVYIVIGLLVLGVATSQVLQWITPAPAQPLVSVAKAQGGGLGVQEAVQKRKELDEQAEDARLRQVLPELVKKLEKLEGTLTQRDDTRQKEAQASQAQLAALQRENQEEKAQVEDLKRQMQASRAAQANAPRKEPARPTAQAPAPAPTLPALTGEKLHLLKGTTPTTPLRPGRANHLQVAHLPAGSFAPGRIVFGAMASSRERSAAPVMMAVTGEFTGPWQLQSPRRAPLQTALEIQGCFVIGRAAGDLAMSRVLIQLNLLSCVFPSGETVEQAIKGYAYGVDGTYGIPAEVDHHASAQELKAFLSALLMEASAAFGLARSKFVVTTTTSGPQPFQGAQTGLQELQKLYIQQMEYLLPTLWAKARTQGFIWLEEGVTLEGLPTQAIIANGGVQWTTY
jgi:hypothetical protein